MHRLAAIPGGWSPGLSQNGVIFVEQTPAPLILGTMADTDIQVLATAVAQLAPEFPPIRVVNLLQLGQQLAIDTYAEDVLAQARGIVLRLLGGRAYWRYGLEVVQELVGRSGASLFVLPGDDRPDLDLFSLSTVPLAAHQLWRYFTEGGVTNAVNGLKFFANTCLEQNDPLLAPQPVPRMGLYEWQRGSAAKPTQDISSNLPTIAILFYRAHYLAGNTAVIDALCQAIGSCGLEPLPVYVQSLQEPEIQLELQELLTNQQVQVILNTTGFSLLKPGSEPQLSSLDGDRQPDLLWERFDEPVLQVICSSSTQEQWQSQFQGLLPRDIAMNVALPEVDGRIISRAVSFKSVQKRHPLLETDVVTYEPVGDRIQFVADLAANWVKLRQTPVQQRHIALILANYPTRDGRLANGVGLDTPASCIEILQALQQAGYDLGNGPLPETGDELITWLTRGVTNDPEGQDLRLVRQSLPLENYQAYFASLPEAVQQAVSDRYGSPDTAVTQLEITTGKPSSTAAFAIPGIQLGKIFIGIQPARGYDLDPALNYHAPDLEPPHSYFAFYDWIRHHFAAHAIVHVGKHGNLEWLPGKSIALSETCYPEVALGPLPHLYPFIVNDPGEGSQAKRRSQAVIIDHLTPPLTRAELYGPLQQLEHLIDEYYEAENLDPQRLALIRDRIVTLVQQHNLDQELVSTKLEGRGQGELEGRGQKAEGRGQRELEGRGQRAAATGLTTENWTTFLTQTDGYLCELKEAQIRDGLHIFGQCPQGRQLRDLLIALARQPGHAHRGITRALCQDWELDLDPLTAEMTQVLTPTQIARIDDPSSPRTVGDLIEILESQAADLVEKVIADQALPDHLGSATRAELEWMGDRLLPALQQTDLEITNLLRGLDGRYIPSGPSGAPTRGRLDVLPTGRNFYSVDLRALPTETAWDVGRKAAAALIERYTQEHGEYPRSLGLSLWGTATMRTGGDDLAEALALMGVQPVWDGLSRRVIDFEILPLSLLGRPRVDVTLRISGFFRDAFPNLIDLFDQAVAAVSLLKEASTQNPLAAQVRAETQHWQEQGLTPEQAVLRSRYRIFGSKPGAYGAGLQGLIEAQNWVDDHDLARAYMNWSNYAYTGAGNSHTAPEAFNQRLSQMQIVLHNQDNREHDLLDSDDYYQFQGGLTAAVRAIRGEAPKTYFGDHSQPEKPKIRTLQEEMARVYRSRVINPKWIAGVMRHGYKGAFEMAATVDYLFAYDATTHCVADHMYQGVAEAYLFDPAVQAFIQQKNPWALRDMAERMLEAHQRHLWSTAQPETLATLRAIALQAEAVIEGHLDPTSNREGIASDPAEFNS